MKKLFFIAGLVLLFAACSNESENMVINAQMEKATAPVMVHVNGFSVYVFCLKIHLYPIKTIYCFFSRHHKLFLLS